MEKTSVIIPTFNRPEYLHSCIESVLLQTLSPGEVIVVDDGSTGDTKRVVDQFGDRVEYIRKENSGKAASLNVALAHSSKPFVWIVDDDDIVCPDALDRLTRLLVENPDAGFAYGRHLRFHEDTASGKRQFLPTGHWRDCAPDEFLKMTLEDFFVHQPGMLVRRSLYDAVGPFDETLMRSQDYEMLIRLARAARSVSTDAVVFWQRQHNGARGSRTERFAATDSVGKWIEIDQQIFRALYDNMPLSDFLPGAPKSLSKGETRHALLQRGVIMARRKLWSAAVDDFNKASLIDSGPLSGDEKTLLRRAFASKFGCREIVEDRGIRAMLRNLSADSPNGFEIRRSLAAGLRWRVREAATEGQLWLSARYAGLLVSLMSSPL